MQGHMLSSVGGSIGGGDGRDGQSPTLLCGCSVHSKTVTIMFNAKPSLKPFFLFAAVS